MQMIMYFRAMLTDQTIEEMEAGLSDAHNMSANTAAKAEDMAKKLSIRSKELGYVFQSPMVPSKRSSYSSSNFLRESF